MMKDRMIQNGIEYEHRGEQYYPILKLDEHITYEIGKYGKLHLAFMKQHCRGTYTTLLTENRLNEHLHNIDEQAHEQIDIHIAQMAKQMCVTEELKASDPMRWVQMMNNIKASAEEIVLKEVVYK
ncbi:MAG: TnpV protein [Clostridia bacterium]|nr:TnpV protein [Clostridia bacterium]